MPVAIAEVAPRQSVGNYFEKIVDITLDTAYPTNGSALSAGDLGFASILSLMGEVTQGAVVRSVSYDRANAKLLAYVPAGTEVVNTTNISAVVTRCVVRGR